ncbi:MAG TPA: toprim domain-containing protein [Thermodesulfovibrio thiophilus]|nr:toprim domain-containing protein [Thermodesulfovibrio thiophilus]
MRKDKLLELAKLLNLRNVNANSEWVNSCCPFEHELHSEGIDRTPSFGMSISNPSVFYCFGCQVKGLVVALPSLLSMITKKNLTEARKFVFLNEIYEPKTVESLSIDVTLSYIDTEVLKSFAKVPKHIYEPLGFSKETVEKYNLLYDKPSQRLVFTIRDESGKLVGLRGRYLGRNEYRPKYLTYTKLKKGYIDPKSAGIWYLCDEKQTKKFLFLVEGEKDALLLKQYTGVDVIASMGASITDKQLEKLKNVNKNIVLFFDNDKAGEIAKQKVIKSLNNNNRLYHVTNYYGCKDPAELCTNKSIFDALKSIKKI